MLAELTQRLYQKQGLSPMEATEALEALLAPKPTDQQKADFLKALSQKGETSEEIVGFARGLMSHCQLVPLPEKGIDLCGTGGSGKERFNVSTGVAFLLSAMGIPVSKHGNRGSKKNNGSFDFLEALGIHLSPDLDKQLQIYHDFKLCFLFARAHHPTVKAVGPARALVGGRTIFNLVGPLCNPSQPDRQVVGVADPKLGPVMAEALRQLDRKSAMVVWGEPGIDELSLCGNNKIWNLDQGMISEFDLDHEDLGEPRIPWESLPAGDAESNAKTFLKIIQGESMNGLDRVLALNAASAMVVHTPNLTTISLPEAYTEALHFLNSGRVHDHFQAFLKAQS